MIQHENKDLSVNGFVAIRIPGSVKDAGFTLIRRGRVIIGGSEKNYRPSELFGDANSYPWQRLYGELHMDNWPVTQAKDDFDWHNSGLEEVFISKLEPLIREFRKKSENIRVRERINTNDLIQSAVMGLSDSGLIENINIEIVEDTRKENESLQDDFDSSSTPIISSEELNVEIVDTDNAGVIIEGGNLVKYQFKYRGTEYLFHIIFDVMNPNLQWLLVERNGSNEFTLSINMKHSFFRPLIEKREFLPIMTRMSIALALAEIEAYTLSLDGKIEPCDIRLKMNEILEYVRKGNDNG